MNQTRCPDRDHLQQLLSGALPDGECSSIEGHLDTCSCCQSSLEKLAEGEVPLADALRELGSEERPASDSAYWPALERVEAETAATVEPQGTSFATALRSLTLEFLEPTETPGNLGRLGHFDVERLLGRGGMGMVLRAFDTHLQRPVAIKVLDPHMADDTTARKRFCREARSAASITHENVVSIYHVEREETSGLPFLVMQIVAGESLQERLDRDGPLGVEEILRIGLQTALGLAAAHERGLVHRDIKPANILLEAGSNRVKLTDFGLARASEDVRLTQTGFVTGTPLYMAPEQAKGEQVDHRSDLYSLGAVLYQMATGKPPFEADTPLAMLRRVTEEEPEPVRKLNERVPADLAQLIERLLAKDPDERYQSSAEVAGLLGQMLARLEPSSTLHVALPSVKQVSGRLRRPDPWQRWWMVAAVLPWVFVGVLAALELFGLTHLRSALLPQDEAESPARLVLSGNAGPVWSVAFSPDSHTVAAAIDDGTLRLWDADSGRIRATVNAHKAPIWSVAFSGDGKLLATASDDGTVRLFETDTWKPHGVLKHETSVRAVAFAPTSDRVATGGRNGSVRIWSVDNPRDPIETQGHEGIVVAIAWSPDGRTVASAGGDKVVKLWDAKSGQQQAVLSGHQGGVYAVAFSPDSATVVSGGWDKSVRLWDVASGSAVAVLPGHRDDVWGVAFARDGRHFASASEDRTVRLWDAASKQTAEVYRGHTGTVYAVSFAPDGHTLASGGRNGTVRLWDLPR